MASVIESVQFGLKDVVYMVVFLASFLISNASSRKDVQMQVEEVKRVYLPRAEFAEWQKELLRKVDGIHSIISDVRDRTSRIEGIVTSQD